MERKICRDVVCTSHKDEEGKHTPSACRSLTDQPSVGVINCLMSSLCARFSSRPVRAASVLVTTSWRFPQQEHEILPEGELRFR